MISSSIDRPKKILKKPSRFEAFQVLCCSDSASHTSLTPASGWDPDCHANDMPLSPSKSLPWSSPICPIGKESNTHLSWCPWWLPTMLRTEQSRLLRLSTESISICRLEFMATWLLSNQLAGSNEVAIVAKHQSRNIHISKKIIILQSIRQFWLNFDKAANLPKTRQ